MLKVRISGLLLLLAVAGCASTAVVVHPLDVSEPSTQCGASALVLWGPVWRQDQKEPALREEIAAKALTQFFAESRCFSDTQVLRQANGKSAIALSDLEALDMARVAAPRRDKVVFIRLEELGPLVKLNLALVLLEGATEVKLRVRILDAATSTVTSDRAVHWTNGGAYVVKGTATLQQDMVDALKVALPQ